MFSINQIQAAHASVKSGADFPNYIQALIQLGVCAYDTFVDDGHSVYMGKDNYVLVSEAKYARLEVAQKSDETNFAKLLRLHQQGQTDYKTFLTHAAETGVEKWTVNMSAMSCTYYDRLHHVMLEEKIPQAPLQ